MKNSNYRSEFTLWLEQFKQSNPHIEHEQRAGRSLLWDQPPRTLEDQRRDQLSRVAKKPYEYYSFDAPVRRTRG